MSTKMYTIEARCPVKAISGRIFCVHQERSLLRCPELQRG
nr:MAG TPA: hypothetical protein [Caudoviricetes sp.]